MSTRQLVLIAKPEVAAHLHESPRATSDDVGDDSSYATAANALVSEVRALGAALRPIHPGTSDRTLATQFVVELPDTTTVADAAERLRTLAGVDAAYTKPSDALP